MSEMKSVVVIGAGAAGLASARHASSAGLQCEVLEMGPEIGGTWRFTEDVGHDRYGFPVYSAMYQGLRTNLPKEVMGFPDFPIPDRDKSYLSQAEILDFLNSYADHYGLRQYIRLNRMVTDVRPYSNNRWLVVSVDKPTKREIRTIYDAVMVCNGHYNDPIIPEIENQSAFKGSISHSRDYRNPNKYCGSRVLVIGAGPSGLDLALHISAVAKYVVLSHHTKEAHHTEYPNNVSKKPDVVRIRSDGYGVEFTDGTISEFDNIIYCTGYSYSFPFLHETCGVSVDDNHITPLYKHLIHIHKPTMGFIGIPFNVCAFQMFDLQARFYCKYLTGQMALPSTEQMLADTEKDMANRWAKGYTKRQAHMMGPDQINYYLDLAVDANTPPIAPVIVKLRDESVKRLYDDLQHFREDRYKIVDDESFIKLH